jgi:hypothetical protein
MFARLYAVDDRLAQAGIGRNDRRRQYPIFAEIPKVKAVVCEPRSQTPNAEFVGSAILHGDNKIVVHFPLDMA